MSGGSQPSWDEMLAQAHIEMRDKVAAAIQRGAVYSVPRDHLLHLADAVMEVVDEEFLRVAADIHHWADQMSTQKARTSAMFAADRVCELVGLQPDRAIDLALQRAKEADR